jgi:hypothetical protein
MATDAPVEPAPKGGEQNAEARLARRGAGSVLVVLLLAARLSFDVELARALTDDEDRERVCVET